MIYKTGTDFNSEAQNIFSPGGTKANFV